LPSVLESLHRSHQKKSKKEQKTRIVEMILAIGLPFPGQAVIRGGPMHRRCQAIPRPLPGGHPRAESASP
jgi:hypothetical protein